MGAPRQVSIRDFLTWDQVKLAIKLYGDGHSSRFHQDMLEQIIEPNMAEINRKLGQENDPSYLAHAVEYVMSRSRE